MPGSVANASPVGVMPVSLCTAFAEDRDYAHRRVGYHGGEVERGAQASTSRRSWKLGKKLNAADLATLETFFETTCGGGMKAFFFYDPYQPAMGQAIGANYDPTGTSVQGRVTVVFRGSWSVTTGLARSEAGVELVEVA